mgnify:CR=1 FL=1
MLSDSELKKHDERVNSLGELVDDYRTLKDERESFFSALESVSDYDAGLLGGDEDWSVGQWHDYIRSIIGEIQQIANEVL